jgi:hypothetical protein
MLDLTVAEAKALRAVVMGDNFGVSDINSALEKIEAFLGEGEESE